MKLWTLKKNKSAGEAVSYSAVTMPGQLTATLYRHRWQPSNQPSSAVGYPSRAHPSLTREVGETSVVTSSAGKTRLVVFDQSSAKVPIVTHWGVCCVSGRRKQLFGCKRIDVLGKVVLALQEILWQVPFNMYRQDTWGPTSKNLFGLANATACVRSTLWEKAHCQMLSWLWFVFCLRQFQQRKKHQTYQADWSKEIGHRRTWWASWCKCTRNAVLSGLRTPERYFWLSSRYHSTYNWSSRLSSSLKEMSSPLSPITWVFGLIWTTDPCLAGEWGIRSGEEASAVPPCLKCCAYTSLSAVLWTMILKTTLWIAIIHSYHTPLTRLKI